MSAQQTTPHSRSAAPSSDGVTPEEMAAARDGTVGEGARELWAKTRIIASMWWCGDEWCDCTQPKIERITPNQEAGYPWVRRQSLWEGSFRSQAEPDEAKEQAQELVEAIARFRARGHEVEDHR